MKSRAALFITALMFSGSSAFASPLTDTMVKVIHLVEDQFPETSRTTMFGTDLALRYRLSGKDLGQILGDAFGLDQEYLGLNIHRCNVFTPACIASVILQLKR